MFTARFPKQVEQNLAQYAAQLGMSKSALALHAVEDLLKHKPLKPNQGRLTVCGVDDQQGNVHVAKMKLIQKALKQKYAADHFLEFESAKNYGRR